MYLKDSDEDEKRPEPSPAELSQPMPVKQESNNPSGSSGMEAGMEGSERSSINAIPFSQPLSSALDYSAGLESQ